MNHVQKTRSLKLESMQESQSGACSAQDSSVEDKEESPVTILPYFTLASFMKDPKYGESDDSALWDEFDYDPRFPLSDSHPTEVVRAPPEFGGEESSLVEAVIPVLGTDSKSSRVVSYPLSLQGQLAQSRRLAALPDEEFAKWRQVVPAWEFYDLNGHLLSWQKVTVPLTKRGLRRHPGFWKLFKGKVVLKRVSYLVPLQRFHDIGEDIC